MYLKKSALLAAMTGALATTPALAAQLDTDKLDIEIYGAAKVSVDHIDDGADSNVQVSNNSSRIGFKGSYPIKGDYKAVWKLENSIDVTGETGGLGARDRYAGFAGPYGETRFGNHDTPFKDVFESVDPFDNTIGDRRNIMGLDSDGGDSYNLRAKNAIMYLSPVWSGLQVHALYSSSRDATATGTGADDNDKKLGSASLIYDNGPLHLRVGYERQQGNGSGVRLGASYQIGATTLGVLAESLDGDGKDALSREAYGLNVQHAVTEKTKLVAQALMADDSDAGDDTDATNYTVAVFHNLHKKIHVYAAFSATDNSDAARYTVAAGGHDGDKIKAAGVGEDPQAFSIGMSLGF